jgi:hypothetical protein
MGGFIQTPMSRVSMASFHSKKQDLSLSSIMPPLPNILEETASRAAALSRKESEPTSNNLNEENDSY